MTRFALPALLAAALLAAAPAHALTTVRFTGTVTSSHADGVAGPAVGESVSGWYTFSYPAAATNPATTGSDGRTWNEAEAWNYTGTDIGMVIEGGATFSGGLAITLSSTDGYQYLRQSVYREYVGSLDVDASIVETYRVGDYTWNFLEAGASDNDGAASTLFTDPDAGVTFAQGAASTHGYGDFQGSTSAGRFYGDMQLTSFSVSASSVPEPAGLVLTLAGAALVGWRARRRQVLAA